MSRAAISVDRLLLARVTFPHWHPRVAEGGCDVFGYAVSHPDGIILFDTGVGIDNPLIEELYHPTFTPINEALAAVHLDINGVVAVVNSHLHFDHCGQNKMLLDHGVPTYVQAVEVTTACTEAHYTVPEWASIPSEMLRLVHGDEQLTAGVRIIETPGHTPGHQSLVVETATGRTVIAGQCIYDLRECNSRAVALDNMHNAAALEAGQASLERILALSPCTIVAAHDSGACAIA